MCTDAEIGTAYKNKLPHIVYIIYSIITARKRSLGQGNVFTPVCHSVQGVGQHPGGVSIRGVGKSPPMSTGGLHPGGGGSASRGRGGLNPGKGESTSMRVCIQEGLDNPPPHPRIQRNTVNESKCNFEI